MQWTQLIKFRIATKTQVQFQNHIIHLTISDGIEVGGVSVEFILDIISHPSCGKASATTLNSYSVDWKV